MPSRAPLTRTAHAHRTHGRATRSICRSNRDRVHSTSAAHPPSRRHDISAPRSMVEVEKCPRDWTHDGVVMSGGCVDGFGHGSGSRSLLLPSDDRVPRRRGGKERGADQCAMARLGEGKTTIVTCARVGATRRTHALLLRTSLHSPPTHTHLMRLHTLTSTSSPRACAASSLSNATSP